MKILITGANGMLAKAVKNEFKCRHSNETYPQIAAKIPMNKCRNGQHQVNLVIYSIDVYTLIGNIVENVKEVPMSYEYFDINDSTIKIKEKYGSLFFDNFAIYSSDRFDSIL